MVLRKAPQSDVVKLRRESSRDLYKLQELSGEWRLIAYL